MALTEITQSLKSWFRWRHRNIGGWASKAWAPALLALRVGSAPKRAAAWQLYHSENKDSIGLEATKQVDAGTAIKKGPALRNAIAKERFDALPAEERAAWEVKADETIAARRKAYENAKAGVVVTDPVQMLE